MEVAVGRISKAHGIRGEVSVNVSTDSPELRFAVGAVVTARMRDRSNRTLTIASVRPHGIRLLVTFEDVSGRDSAEQLRGSLLLADTDVLPPNDDPDEFYDFELEGLDVLTGDGASVGTVKEVVHSPGGELLAVDAGDREILIPFVHQIVPEIDMEHRRITIDPPEGLLDAP